MDPRSYGSTCEGLLGNNKHCLSRSNTGHRRCDSLEVQRVPARGRSQDARDVEVVASRVSLGVGRRNVSNDEAPADEGAIGIFAVPCFGEGPRTLRFGAAAPEQ